MGPAIARLCWIALCLLSSGTPAWAERDANAVPRVERVDSIEARVQGCATCHGWQGQGTSNDYFPRIAGKPAGYLLNQLRAFRTGARQYAPMNYLLAYMTDDYLREIADYFAAQQPPFNAPTAPALQAADLSRARTLVQSGDPARQLPACMSCHGPNLTGMQPGIPGLVGLRPNYINAQLTRWRAGDRRGAQPDCMHRIATRLADGDIVAIAQYLGSLPAPASPQPEARNTARMPMACGSQQ